MAEAARAEATRLFMSTVTDITAKAVLKTDGFLGDLRSLGQRAREAAKGVREAFRGDSLVSDSKSLTKQIGDFSKIGKAFTIVTSGIQAAQVATSLWKRDSLEAQAALEKLPFGIGEIVGGVHELAMEWSGVNAEVKANAENVKAIGVVMEGVRRASRDRRDQAEGVDDARRAAAMSSGELVTPAGAARDRAIAAGQSSEKVRTLHKQRDALREKQRDEESKAAAAIRSMPEKINVAGTHNFFGIPGLWQAPDFEKLVSNTKAISQANSNYQKMQADHAAALKSIDEKIAVEKGRNLFEQTVMLASSAKEWAGIQYESLADKARLWQQEREQRGAATWEQMKLERDQKNQIADLDAEYLSISLAFQGRSTEAQVAAVKREFEQRTQAAQDAGQKELVARLALAEKQSIELLKAEETKRKSRERAGLLSDIVSAEQDRKGQSYQAALTRIKGQYLPQIQDALDAKDPRKAQLLMQKMRGDQRDAWASAMDQRGAFGQNAAGMMSFAGLASSAAPPDKMMALDDPTIQRLAAAIEAAVDKRNTLD